jgi:adenylate cyclase
MPNWLSRANARWMAWPGVAVVLAIALLSIISVPVLSPALERIGLLVFDSYQRAAPRVYEDAPVRIVDIDDETIRRYGQWPWPRTDMARLTLALGEAGAAAIAFDIVFSEADRTSPAQIAKRFAKSDPAAARTLAALPDNDAQLASIFGATPVVAGYFLTNDQRHSQAEAKAGLAVIGSDPTSLARYRNAVLPLPQLSAAAAGLGFVSIKPDADSIIRRAPLIAVQRDMLLPSLALDAVRVANQAQSVKIKTSNGSGEFGAGGDVVSLQINDMIVPTTAKGELWMHYTGPVPKRVVPAWKILSGTLSAAEREKLFAGQIIFVGASAIGLRDLRATPLNANELGVMIHAQAAEQMILGKFLSRPDWALGLEISLLLVLGILMSLLLARLGALKGALLGGAAVGAIIAGSWYAFTEQRLLLDPTYPVIGITLAYLVQTVITYYREEKQRAYIHRAFDRYLSPELVKRIADDPGQLELGGEERDMTVMFCDIRSFSSISENLKPNEIIGFLIRFLTPMTDLLLARKATIDKYIGDAILAFWNAPLTDTDQYRNAARGALDMIARLRTLNYEMQAQTAEPWPGEVKIGIGLNAGPCCVGNMGSQQRLSYSLIGDTVNLASRIEGLTKYYGVQVAIGSALKAHLPDFATVVIDKVRVIGRSAPETIHVLLGDESLSDNEAFHDFSKAHDAMLTAYQNQNWEMAGHLLDENEDAAAQFGLSRLYAMYRDRILIFATTSPGADWDGVFTATEK